MDKYAEELRIWKGDINAFNSAVEDAEEIFGPLITISPEESMINERD